MNFINYIKGKRKGSEAHRIEKDSMKDPFMYEAIEGFDSINDNHIDAINNIQNRLRAKNKSIKYKHPIWRTIAASSILAFAIGGYLLIMQHKSNSLHANESNANTIINIYVPENYYAENIVVISKHNTEALKSYKPNIKKFKIDEKTNYSINENEIASLADDKSIKDEVLVDIYIPDNFNKESDLETKTKKGKPEPSIGYEKYNLYLKKALQRPTDDSCKDRKGKVAIEFSVDDQGRPYLFEVKYSLCGTSDNEAIRLIQSGPKWIPGSERATVKVEF